VLARRSPRCRLCRASPRSNEHLSLVRSREWHETEILSVHKKGPSQETDRPLPNARLDQGPTFLVWALFTSQGAALLHLQHFPHGHARPPGPRFLYVGTPDQHLRTVSLPRGTPTDAQMGRSAPDGQICARKLALLQNSVSGCGSEGLIRATAPKKAAWLLTIEIGCIRSGWGAGQPRLPPKTGPYQRWTVLGRLP
jgi:hypothetical protein